MIRTTIDEPNDKDKNETSALYNHKGQPCRYKSITCEEGYCNKCPIYLDWCKSLWY